MSEQKRREYMTLGRGHGMTLQEIADELGITNAGAQYILNSALQKLRKSEMPILLNMKLEAEGLSKNSVE